jgi:hypothetical protein
MGCDEVMSVLSKGVEKRHLDPWAHLHMQPKHFEAILSIPYQW